MKVLFLVLGGIAGLLAVAALLAVIVFSAWIFGSVALNALRRPKQLAVIAKIAVRNLFASRLKTFIVGGIITLGAVLIVVGTSFVGSVTNGMRSSIIGAAAGDVQVYAPKYPDGGGDALSIWGGMNSDPDLGTIPDFSKLKTALLKVPNVKSVVPMGISAAMVTSGNTIDLALGDLRQAEDKLHAGDTSQAVRDRIGAQKAHLQHIVKVLEGDQKNRHEISADDRAGADDDQAALLKANSPAFWNGFDQDPFNSLEFLDNKIAPQAADADLLYLRYVGTNLQAFQRSFDRMQIVDGTEVPPGQRGFLFAKTFYEDNLKLKNARRLDQIHDEIETNHEQIATDESLQRLVRENTTQTREIVLQLDDIKAAQMRARLQKITGSKETDVEKLLAVFFNTTDQNFESRYHDFYSQIAPLLDLYRIRVGDILTIKAYTKSGYTKSVNVKVYGTFQFKGLEKSVVAGSLNLIDLQSFRDLYGFLTPDTLKEVEQIKKEAGTETVTRKDAESELFGADAAPEVAPANDAPVAAPAPAPAPASTPSAATLGLRATPSRTYTEAELEHGAVVNAAVFLKDPSKATEAIPSIEKAGDTTGTHIKAIGWQEAAGTLGQMVLLFWAIFLVASIIIAFVALIIVNNALLTATLERVREFGTLRAIGAQKPFILTTVVVEAMVTGVIFGTVGAVLGAGVVLAVHAHGIGATADIMYFLFSGPRFMPVLSVSSMVIALVAMSIISAFASLIPAYLAMRVSPVKAMQSED